MIAAGVDIDNFKGTVPSKDFRVQPPKLNPLVAGSALRLIKQDEGDVSVEWSSLDADVPMSDLVLKVRADVIGRARKQVSRFPKSSRAHGNLGIALLSQGERDEAKQELETAIRIDSKNYVAWVNLARVMVDQGRFDAAEEIYHKMREEFPSEWTSTLSLALIAMKRNDFGTAERMLKRAVELDDDNVLAKYHLAMVLISLRKTREAIKLLKQAVHSEVRSPALYHALGVGYAMSGNLDRAEVAFKSALTLAPNLRRSVHALAKVLLDKSEVSSALQLLAEYLKHFGNDLEARQLLGRAYMGIEQYRSAATQFMSIYQSLADRTEPESLEKKAAITNDIGTCLALDHKDQESEVWFRRSIESAPNAASRQYQNLARVYLRLSRDLDAFEILRECKKRFPQDQDTSLLIATCYERQNLYREGVRELKSIVQRGDAKPDVYSMLGFLLDYDGDLDEALRCLNDGHHRYPQHEPTIHNLIYVLLRKGEIREGRKLLQEHQDVLEEYAESDPSYRPVLTATWGLLYILDGNIELGSRLYRQAAKLSAHRGNRELSHAILQKMHLELAKILLAEKEFEAARKETLAGLAIRKGREPFRRELQRIQMSITS